MHILNKNVNIFNHDENACFKQFINKIVKIRNFIKSESFNDCKNFRLCNARKIFDRIKIKKFRNVN
jgi:hypothetical protein